MKQLKMVCPNCGAELEYSGSEPHDEGGWRDTYACPGCDYWEHSYTGEDVYLGLDHGGDDPA